MSDLAPKQQVPITDSPWFWILLFSLVGLAALAAIRPKFERREQAIETKFHARERAYGREAKDQPAADPPPTAGRVFEPVFTLGPIAAAIGIVALASLVGVLRFAMRQRVGAPGHDQTKSGDRDG